MTAITYIASRVYTFFVLIGKIGLLNFNDILDYAHTVYATNPIDPEFILGVSVGLGDSLGGTILEWIVNTLNIPHDFTVFDALLFAFATLFVVSLVVRLYSFVTPD